MTDYFALLNQPRRPWLDADELKQAFHARSLRLHPDAQRNDDDSLGGADAAFSELNEAYQVLQDPKRRIHHLLSLEGRASTNRQAPVPPEIEQLFSTVAGVTQQAEVLAQKSEAATAPLSRSLLKPQVLQLQSRIGETLRQLFELHDAGIAELRQLSAEDALQEDDWTRLQGLYLRFSYLTRWIAELQEKQSRLVTS
jgi:curved DNA-binding protein CbpA